MQRAALCFGLFFLMLAGCAPHLTPTLAERVVKPDSVAIRTGSAAVGESLLRGDERFVYAVYSPLASVAVPVPDRVDAGGLEPGQQWIAFYRLDDSTLVVEAPDGFVRGEERLGLRLDGAGMVVGNRPWFDLRARARLNQPPWTGPRLLFRESGTYPVDVFAFDVRYAGSQGGNGLFDVRDFKEAGMKPAEWKRVVVAPGETLGLHGLAVSVIEVLPGSVRYEIGPAR